MLSSVLETVGRDTIPAYLGGTLECPVGDGECRGLVAAGGRVPRDSMVLRDILAKGPLQGPYPPRINNHPLYRGMSEGMSEGDTKKESQSDEVKGSNIVQEVQSDEDGWVGAASSDWADVGPQEGKGGIDWAGI